MGATIRTVFLFGFMLLLFTAIGWLIGTYFFGNWIVGSIFFLSIAAVINVISYFYSDRLVLWSYRAKIIGRADAPKLYDTVQKVCIKGDLPMPRIAIVESATPNAFATGRNKDKAVVAATRGLLQVLSDDELEGVIAHEMAHIKGRDMMVMTIAATLAGAIAFAARMLWWNMLLGRRNQGNAWLLLLVAITVPIAALVIRLAISRSREYLADREGAIMIQRPRSLARALAKLEESNRRRPMDRGNPASASLFIVNPFGGQSLVRIFSTHPPIKERIRRLEKLEGELGFVG